MKITSIQMWQVDLPLKEGRYTWSDGKYVEVFDSTVIEIGTDAGIYGYGECCPLGSAYLPAYAAGTRSGIQELAQHLIGCDPRNLDSINRVMDRAMRGHPYAKSPIDIACWDILGKATGLPVYTLLGGKGQEKIALYRAISQQSPDSMARNVASYRKEGYKKFQLKVGGKSDDDIDRIRNVRSILQPEDQLIADANTGWTRNEAIRVVNSVSDIDVYIEQPCLTYNECLSVRKRTSNPFILDEVIDGTENLLRSLNDDAMDAVNLKISKLGGITRARMLRDLCVATGTPMIIEDTWGGDITTAAIAHLAQSTPEEYCFAATDFNSYGTVSIADGAPVRVNGTMQAVGQSGLGVSPKYDVLGNPVFVMRQ